jgi:hypothetical protein
MATITIRFKDGDQNDWTLHEAMDLRQLTRNFASANGRGEIGFGAAGGGVRTIRRLRVRRTAHGGCQILAHRCDGDHDPPKRP